MLNSENITYLRVEQLTNTGRTRKENEDNCFASLEKQLFIVSDGMGGHQAGELASQAVVTVLPALLDHQLSGVNADDTEAVQQAMRDALMELSQRIHKESADKPDLRGMGATAVVAWVCGYQAHIAHMGDSRAYLFRKGDLKQITEDHTLTALLLRHGEITPEEALRHPARGKLSRYVGMEGQVFPDVQTIELEDGDMLMMCSDGLSGMVNEAEMLQILRGGASLKATCRSLVGKANANGGSDNITAVLVKVGKPGTSRSQAALKKE